LPAALKAAGTTNLKWEIRVDLYNPLDFSHGLPSCRFVSNTEPLGD
jgi:hypothetical protein